MKKLKLNIGSFILILLLLICFMRFDKFLATFNIVYLSLKALVVRSNAILSSFSFDFLELLFSYVLLFAMLIIIYLLRNKNILRQKLTLLGSSIAIILSLVFFAPIIADQLPNFQNNVKIAKLLSPFSSKTILELNNKNDELSSVLNSMLPRVENETYITCDSVKIAGKEIKYYISGSMKTITENSENYNISNNLFLLGTDQLGRDIFSRVIYGARFSVILGLISVCVAFIIGSFFGFASIFSKIKLDFIINRITDMFLAFPMLFLLVLLIGLFGNSFILFAVILGICGWMSLYKVVRAETIGIINSDFVVTSKNLGISKTKIFWDDILRNISGPIIVNLLFLYVSVIFAESALSFLGLGVQGENPSWGNMIHSGYEYVYKAWWISFFPGAMLTFTLVAFSSLGKTIRQKINSNF